jgi:uncharacterized protein with HEPN domain
VKRTNWLEQLLASLPPALEEPPEGDPDDLWHFDPDRDNLAEVIEAVESDSWDYNDKGLDGLAWLRIGVGLDFADLQARWKQIPVISVPKHLSELSDKSGDNEVRGLFAFLDQTRLTYLVGADLAAIALCRATTELLIRRQYAPRAAKSEGLTSLIRRVRKAHPKLEFLKDLFKKVEEANNILHSSSYSVHDLRRDRYQVIVREWVKLLEKMIDEAPEGSPDSLPSPVLRLAHIVDAIERILGEMGSVSLEAFKADWRKRRLVEREVEIISEAILYLSKELTDRHPKIPWSEWADIGNVLRDYDRVDPDKLWDVVKDDLDPLERACRGELAARPAFEPAQPQPGSLRP